MTDSHDDIRPTDIAPPVPELSESSEQLRARLEQRSLQRNRIAWLVRRGRLDDILDAIDVHLSKTGGPSPFVRTDQLRDTVER